MVYYMVWVQRIYQKASLNLLCQDLFFLHIIFIRFFKVEKCGITPDRDSYIILNDQYSEIL